MSNDDVYAAGLLMRALDPATQPPEIQVYLRAELELLRELITVGMRSSILAAAPGDIYSSSGNASGWGSGWTMSVATSPRRSVAPGVAVRTSSPPMRLPFPSRPPLISPSELPTPGGR